jgi:hypothetical protein
VLSFCRVPVAQFAGAVAIDAQTKFNHSRGRLCHPILGGIGSLVIREFYSLRSFADINAQLPPHIHFLLRRAFSLLTKANKIRYNAR